MPRQANEHQPNGSSDQDPFPIKISNVTGTQFFAELPFNGASTVETYFVNSWPNQ
jgi:hypothetical protein